MAIQHQLMLDIPKTNNVKILRVCDVSLYGQGLAADCATLHITSPGFTLPVAIDVLPNFNLVLNACTLGMLPTGACGSSAPAIPDGIYHIRYSVSPNDKVYVEYDHLRVSQISNVLNNERCKLDLAACDPSKDIRTKLEELNLIEDFIKAAVVKVEDCHEPKVGMQLLLYAKKRLEAYVGGCKNC